MLFTPVSDIVQEIMTKGQSLEYKQKLILLDKVAHAKDEVENDKIKKMMQSKKLNIAKMINNARAKRNRQSVYIPDDPVNPQDPVPEITPVSDPANPPLQTQDSIQDDKSAARPFVTQTSRVFNRGQSICASNHSE